MTDDLFSSPPSISNTAVSGLSGATAAQRESVNAETGHGVHETAMGGNTGHLYRGAGACTHCGGLAKGEIMIPYLSGKTAHIACYRQHAEAVARGERRW